MASFKLQNLTSQLGKLKIAMHTLPNISTRKGNQTMKVGDLVEYNPRNIFLEKSYSKYGGVTIPRSFSKNSKLTRLQSRFYIVCFYFMPS